MKLGEGEGNAPKRPKLGYKGRRYKDGAIRSLTHTHYRPTRIYRL